MRDTLNMKIKFRESFRPFAPSVLLDKASEWFEIDCDSPYMLLVAQVREGRRTIPSVTHVDSSARLQTVTREEAPLYYDLIREFEPPHRRPDLINTSFNVRGEPIVCTPHDAYLCFMRTNMDYLVLGHHLLDKRQQPPLARTWTGARSTSWTDSCLEGAAPHPPRPPACSAGVNPAPHAARYCRLSNKEGIADGV